MGAIDAQLARAARQSSGRQFQFNIFTNGVRGTACSGASRGSAAQATHAVVCATAFVFLPRLCPKRMHALSQEDARPTCGACRWEILPAKKEASRAGAASSEGWKCDLPPPAQTRPRRPMPAATYFKLNSQLRSTFALSNRASNLRMCPALSALATTSASLPRGPPVEASPGSRPASLGASRDPWPLRADSAEFLGDRAASWNASRGFGRPIANPFLRTSDAAASSAGVRWRLSNPSAAFFLKAPLTSSKSSGSQITRPCGWVSVLPQP